MSIFFYPPLIALSVAFYGGLAIVGALLIGHSIDAYRYRKQLDMRKKWERP